jgi:hypothetical protein
VCANVGIFNTADADKRAFLPANFGPLAGQINVGLCKCAAVLD